MYYSVLQLSCLQCNRILRQCKALSENKSKLNFIFTLANIEPYWQDVLPPCTYTSRISHMCMCIKTNKYTSHATINRELLSLESPYQCPSGGFGHYKISILILATSWVIDKPAAFRVIAMSLPIKPYYFVWSSQSCEVCVCSIGDQAKTPYCFVVCTFKKCSNIVLCIFCAVSISSFGTCALQHRSLFEMGGEQVFR